ncbi:transcription elongation factor GreA [Nocardioides limicola]|uniref:transcription elongation factor GreA n=1 Tax=Nocardioides limicola TaxID=2803368 RepID=UPI00193B6325|nr:transcription elongation factor GreA [Nocardioides sp. DJM-14]
MPQSTESDTVWLTQDARDKLAAELADLKGPKRQEIIARISSARDEGDLKENGGYHSAREEQGKLEGQIAKLEDILRRAKVGGELPSDGSIAPGMKVTYKFVGDDDDEAEEFLLGAREMEDTTEGLKVYSPQSPLGGAIIGARQGDTVSYEAPTGKILEVVILDAAPFAD